jgi:hypothetical protein
MFPEQRRYITFREYIRRVVGDQGRQEELEHWVRFLGVHSLEEFLEKDAKESESSD